MKEFEEIIESPLFVIGPGRGGTTHLQRLLLSDRRFCGGQESHFFHAFGPVMKQFDRKLYSDRPHGLGCYWRRDDLLDEVRKIWNATFTDCVRQSKGAQLLIEKSPLHSMYVGEINHLLPKARFLHIVRDSRAVAASLMAAYRSGWGKSWAANTARNAAGQWNRSISATLAETQNMSSARYMRIKYEDLLADQAKTLSSVYSWLGVPPTDDLSDIGTGRFWYGGELASKYPSEPEGFVRARGSLGWKNDLRWWEKHLIWYLTRPLMLELGYTRDGLVNV